MTTQEPQTGASVQQPHSKAWGARQRALWASPEREAERRRLAERNRKIDQRRAFRMAKAAARAPE